MDELVNGSIHLMFKVYYTVYRVLSISISKHLYWQFYVQIQLHLSHADTVTTGCEKTFCLQQVHNTTRLQDAVTFSAPAFDLI